MLNYIRSECYHALRRKGSLLFFGAFALLAALANIPLALTPPFNTTDMSMSIALNTLNMGCLFTLVVADMVFSDEYKNDTFKNALSYGYSRTTIFLGKFVAEVIVAFAAAGLIIGMYLISAYLLLGDSPDSQTVTATFFISLLASVPVWLGALALAHTSLFLVRGSTAASFLFAGILTLPEGILTIIGFIANAEAACALIQENLLWAQIPMLTMPAVLNGVVPTFSGVAHAAIVGLAHMVLCLLIGTAAFRRKEI